MKSEKFIQNDTYGAKRWKIWKRDYETWRYHIGLFVVQEEEEGENRIGTKFGDIIVEDFLEVMKYTHSWIQKSKRTLSRVNNKKSTLRCIIVAQQGMND